MIPRSLAAVWLIVATTIVPSGNAQAGVLDGSIELVLDKATVRTDRDSTIRAPIRMSLRFVDGTLLEATSFRAPDYSRGRVDCVLQGVKIDGSTISLTADVTIHNDPWIKGGRGQYKVRLKVEGSDVTGRWRGQFQQTEAARHEIEGPVTGVAIPHWPGIADTVRFQPGEHPRLLFRKEDIATLRQRAESPQGRKLVAELRRLLGQADRGFAWNKCSYRTAWQKRCATPYSEGYYAIGEAAMFLLTDKKAHLERAKYRMLDAMSSRDGEAGGWGNAPRMTGVALCYDMLYDHLDENFRRTVRGFLRQSRPNLTWPLGEGGTHQAMFAAAETLCDLVLLGDPVEPPAKPQRIERAPVIEPLTSDQVGKGVPVQPYRSGVMPSSLLLLGTFAVDGNDPLASLGGPTKARPTIDTAITHAGRTQKAHLLKPSATRLSYGHNYRGHPPIGLNLRLWDGGEHKSDSSVIYAYTILTIDEPRAVIAQPNMPDVSVGNRVWVNGQALEQGQVVRLRKGQYGLLMAAPVRGLRRASSARLRREGRFRPLPPRPGGFRGGGQNRTRSNTPPGQTRGVPPPLPGRVHG